jgi:hypothetical protein
MAISIVWLPRKVDYAEVDMPIVKRLLNKEATRLRFSLEIPRRFIELTLADHGVEAIIRALAEMQSPVLLMDADFHVLASQTIPGKADPLHADALALGRDPPVGIHEAGDRPADGCRLPSRGPL